VPLISTVETFSRLPLHEGRMADAALGVATIQARPNKLDSKTSDPKASGLTSPMPPKKAARFPRAARLLRHADFERVYKQGRRHFSASFTVFYWPRPEAPVAGAAPGPPPTAGLRVGFTVGRALGGAVQRNRMKRRLREAVRMTSPPAGVAADVVINPKKSLLTANFAAIRNEVTKAFAVIEQKLSGKTDAETANRRPEARSPLRLPPRIRSGLRQKGQAPPEGRP
jgi:ribonuclease P protein component